MPTRFSLALASNRASMELGSGATLARDLLAAPVARAAWSHAVQAVSLAAWISAPLYVTGGGGATLTVCCAAVTGWPTAMAGAAAAAAAMMNELAAARIAARRRRCGGEGMTGGQAEY